MRQIHPIWAGVLTFGVAGCPLGCPPQNPADMVAMGGSQLTIRNAGALGTMINDDQNCGFAAQSVLSNPTFTGEVGNPGGSITWSTTDCEIDGGGGKEISKGCDGVTTTVTGKVKITATKTIRGTLTGSATNPVIPEGPNAVTINITKATMDDFKVVNSASTDILTIKSGEISAIIQPRLAVAKANGACSINTPNTRFTDVKLSDASWYIETKDQTATAEVESSNLKAVNGVIDDEENKISGTITLSSQVDKMPPAPKAEKTIPINDDEDGLDPGYDHDKFKAGYLCDQNLASPETYTPVDMTPMLADGAARLTVMAYGTMVGIVDANTTCGFSSAAVGGAASIQGNTGENGTVTFTVASCQIQFASETELSPDCTGAKGKVMGNFTVSGTKVVTGLLTGDAANPVAPKSDSPATFQLTFTPSNFRVGNSVDANALTIKSGTLAGTLTPRTAKAVSSSVCNFTTPMARATNLVYTDASLAVTSGAGTFNLPVSTSSLSAVNGAWGNDTNVLSGTLTIGGHSLTVPSDGKGLNPAFDATAFDTSWQCAPDLVKPVSFACE